MAGGHDAHQSRSQGTDRDDGLVARRAELDLVEQVVRQAGLGAGTSVLLVGEPGIGKSALLEHTVRVAPAHGVRVVTIEGVRGEADLAWAGLSQLVSVGRSHLAALSTEARRALEAATGAGSDGSVSRHAVLVAAHALLAEWAAEAPLVVVADDVHWLDPETVATLVYVARRIQDTPIGIVAAMRDTAAAIDLPVLHVVGSLGDDDARALIDRVAPVTVHPIVADQLVGLAGGNPLALRSTVTSLSADQLAGSSPLPNPLPLAPGLDRLLSTRVEALPVDTRRALAALAILGNAESTVDDVVALAEVGPEALQPAEVSGVVTLRGASVRFAHPLYRSAAYWSHDPPDRRALHRRRSGQENDPVRRALHDADAAVGSDPALATEIEVLAEAAAARGAFGVAATLHDRAATLHVENERRHRCLLAAAEAALEIGNLARVRSLIANLPDGFEAARTLRLRAALSDADGDFPTALSLWREAVSSSHDPWSAADQVIAAGTSLIRRAEIGAARQLMAETAIDVAALDPARAAKIAILAGATSIATGDISDVTLAQFGRYLELDGLDDDTLVPHLGFLADVVAVSLALFVAHDEVFRLTARIERLAVERTIPAVMPGVHTARGMVYNRTNAPAAAAVSQEAVTLAEALGHRTLATSAECFLVFVLGRLGAPETLPLAERMLMSELINLRVSALQGIAAYWMTHGIPEKSLEALLRIHRDPTVDPTGFVQRWQADLGEAAIRCGDLTLARTVMREIDDLGDFVRGSRLVGARHYLEGMIAPIDECGEHFQAAVDASQGDGYIWTRGRAELLWGERLRRARRRAEARPHLETARELFSRHGYGRWAERAEQELLAAGDPRLVSDHTNDTERVLTPHELHVARLAAGGASAKDIAGQLFISPRTVESHLSAIYRKLGVRNRAGFIARAASDPMLTTQP